MGEVSVPEDVYWGAGTKRSLDFFAIGEDRFPREFLRAYGQLKKSAAEVNAALGELPGTLASPIAIASAEVRDGALDAHFPLRVWQTGSGTQTHTNVNEVIANRANELAGSERGARSPVHPNDHVNRGQSTNDTFPTAMHLAAMFAWRESLGPALSGLIATLEAKAEAFRDDVKIGRTHLQDATPLTLGQEISGWAAQLRLARDAVRACEPMLLQLAIGGTAVGTGINAHPRFREDVVRALAEETGLPFEPADNTFAALAGHEACAALSGALAVLAGSLIKVANDVRWLASGPRAGLAEIRIPENEPGSSIMPGKVNPTQAEALIMVALRVLGNETTVSVAASQGNFELNVCKPVIAHAVLESLRLLSDAVRSFDEHCVRGLEARKDRLAAGVEASLMLVTALSPHIGYDEAANIAKQAERDGTTLREAALARGSVSPEDFDRWVVPRRMTRPT